MTYEEMNKGASSPLKQKIEYRSWDWCSFGAVAGLAGGIVVALFGSVFTAISWFAGAGAHIRVIGTVLLVLTIPLLIVGAQCLDLMDRKKDKARESRYLENKS